MKSVSWSDKDLLPQVMHTREHGALLNVTAVIELARQNVASSSKARELIAAYDKAEADVAAKRPYLSEAEIRKEALFASFKSVGISVT